MAEKRICPHVGRLLPSVAATPPPASSESRRRKSRAPEACCLLGRWRGASLRPGPSPIALANGHGGGDVLAVVLSSWLLDLTPSGGSTLRRRRCHPIDATRANPPTGLGGDGHAGIVLADPPLLLVLVSPMGSHAHAGGEST